tara:strand:+ start:44 stop:670 length:627 start_codon:yes stop_codon:yes gene_type:complete
MVKKITLSDGSTYQIKDVTQETISSGGRRLFGSRKRDVRFLTDDLMAEINNGVRNAAVQVMNDLAKKGPVWSGEFRDSWIATSKQKTGGSASSGSFPYNLNNIPQLSLKQKQQVKKIEITNTSKWAKYALDLEAGRFFPTKEQPNPKGDIVKSGKRNITTTTFRGDITSGDGKARITAPLDWYSNYLKGGEFKQSLGRGLQMGFKGKK